MRLIRLQLTRYGHFKDFAIDFGQPSAKNADFHIIYGANEAGKSTLFNAYLDLLFGIEQQSAYNFLYGYGEMRIDAVLETAEGALTLWRQKSNKDALRDAENNPLPDTILEPELAGLDRNRYRTMFSLNEEGLRDGGNDILKSDGDLGQLLFAGMSGLTDISEYLRQQKSQAEEFFKPVGWKFTLTQLNSELKALQEQINQADTNIEAYNKLQSEYQLAEQAYEKAQSAHREVIGRQRACQRLQQAIRPWYRLQDLREEISLLPDLPAPPPAWPDRLEELIKAKDLCQGQQQQADGQIEMLERHLADVNVDKDLLAQAAAIERLKGTEPDFHTAQRRLPMQREAAKQSVSDLRRLHKEIGLPLDSELDDLVLTTKQEFRLRQLIEQSNTVSEQAARAEEDLRDAAHDLSLKETALNDLPPVASEAQISQWQNDWADLSQIARQIQADLTKLEEQRAKLQADVNILVEKQGVIPDHTAQAAIEHRNTAWHAHWQQLQEAPQQALETAKRFYQALQEHDQIVTQRARNREGLVRLRQAELEIAGCDAQVQSLSDQQNTNAAKQEDLRRIIAKALENEASPDVALHDTRTLVGRKQTISDAHRKAAEKLQRHRDAADQVEAAQRAWKTDWDAALADCWVGTIAEQPDHVAALLTRLPELSSAHQNDINLKHSIKESEQDIASYNRAVKVITSALQRETKWADVNETVDTLRQELAIAKQAQQDQEKTQDALTTQKAEQDRTDLRLKRINQEIAQMAEHFGCADAQALRQAMHDGQERQQKVDALKKDELDLLTLLGKHNLADAETLLEEKIGNDQQIEALQQQLADLEAEEEEKLKLRDRTVLARHEAENSLKAVVGGDEAAKLRERYQTKLLEIQEQAEQYMRQRLGIMAVEHALQAYRQQNRSTMMRHAAETFRTISRNSFDDFVSRSEDGRELLFAKRENGAQLATENMSEGTRNQLYLALRVAGYHEFLRDRRPVPFIADDILNTFDDMRATETFRILADLARHGQVIYLTHHRHLCDIAREICGQNVHIHELPSREMSAVP